MNQITDVVKSLIIINVLMFVGTMMIPDDYRNMLALYFPLSEGFQPFQIVTHMFMHSKTFVFHIIFNMYLLYMFGTALESLWGPKRFLFYYLFTGFGASALYLLVKYFEYQNIIGSIPPGELESVMNTIYGEGYDVIMSGRNFANERLATLNGIVNVPMLGASGAVFGLLVGFGMKFPDTRLGFFFIPYYFKAKYVVIFYGLLELYLGLSGFNTGIAHFAHLGGALFGFLLIKYWEKNGSRL